MVRAPWSACRPVVGVRHAVCNICMGHDDVRQLGRGSACLGRARFVQAWYGMAVMARCVMARPGEARCFKVGSGMLWFCSYGKACYGLACQGLMRYGSCGEARQGAFRCCTVCRG